MRYGNGQNYRIRGFSTNVGSQSVSHDFFTALEPTDNYNLERITLALGPNALLIGVGNPQGVAVTTTKRAQLEKRKTSVQVQVDSEGSNRFSIDHNQPLIADKLALRVNLLQDKAREFRQYEGRNQERMTLGMTAKPFADTTVRVNYERYSVDNNAAPLRTYFNSGVIRWLAAGKPTIEFLPNGQLWTANRAYVDANGNRIPVAPGVVDADGFVDAATDFNTGTALTQIGGHQLTWVTGLGLANPMVNMRYQGNLANAIFNGVSHGNYQTMDPWDALGLKKNTNLNGGTWEDAGNQQNGNWTQFMVEQKLANNLYLELAGNVAIYNQSLDPGSFIQVGVDPNRYLPDGSVNPGYLVPFANNSANQFRPWWGKNTEYRATLSYDLDLTEKNRWFGSHSFAGLYQDSTNQSREDISRVMNAGSVNVTGNGWNADALNGVHSLTSRAYFLNGNVPVLPDEHQILKNIDLLNSYGNFIGATANERAPINLAPQLFLPGRWNRATDESISLGWQARWWDSRLITVVGYRSDDTESFAALAGNDTRSVALPEINGSDTILTKRYWAPSDTLFFDDQPNIAANGISRTYGAVFHALPWISLTYNQSNNFLPVGNASWVNAFNEPAPNSEGATKEYGVRFNLLDDKLAISLTKFRTSADDQARNANGSAAGSRNAIARLRDNYKTLGDSHFQDLLDLRGYTVEPGDLSDTWSYTAEGYEMNLTYNPSRDWRIAVSGSINTNKLGDHLLALNEWVRTDTKFTGLGTWRNYASELNKVAAGQKSTFFDLDPTNPTHVAQAAADALYINQQVDAQENLLVNDQALTGITTSSAGKYALNGLITRVFNEGRLKGWTVGGNFRWRSGGNIGYEDIFDASGNPSGVIDISKPLTGEQIWDIGAMVSYRRKLTEKIDMRVQLNVQNLPNFQDPVIVKMAYDTNAYNGTPNEIIPVIWELRRPRKYVLTTSFEF
jgi:iron complex outermembrane recepter protein